jgi:conjugative transposon TraN protein
MKRLREALVIATVILFLYLNTQAQAVNEMPNAHVIPSLPLAICVNKTTNLVFPFKIKSVDRGSKDLLVQKAKGVENVLQLKAAIENFEETNLSVITSDGRLYSFVVHYSSTPGALNLHFVKDSSVIKEPGLQFASVTNEALIETDAQNIMERARDVFWIMDKKYGIRMRLTGLYVRNDVLYFQIQLQNRSTINYDIDMLHFFIKDRKQTRRTASQELPVLPLYIYGNNLSIKGDSSQSLVYALPKFTIPDKKWLHVQMMEKNGGRHLHLRIGNRIIVNAKQLAETPSSIFQ